jgi:hypothetical protein
MATATTFAASVTTISSAIATAAAASALTAEHIQGSLDFFVGS